MIWTEQSYDASGSLFVAVIDTDAGTYALTIDGVPWESRPATAEEVAAATPPADPRADLLEQAVAATTVAKLRAVLVAALDSGVI